MQNGQEVRVVVDGKPRRFVVAEVLIEDDDKHMRCGHSGIPRDATRWDELLVVRTTRGAIAIRGSSRTRWQGEHDRDAWSLAESEAAAARLLADAIASDDTQGITAYLAKRALEALGWWDLVADEA